MEYQDSKLGRIVNDLKNMATQLNVPILLMSQLSRDIECKISTEVTLLELSKHLKLGIMETPDSISSHTKLFAFKESSLWRLLVNDKSVTFLGQKETGHETV